MDERKITDVNTLEDFAPNLRPVLERSIEQMDFLNEITKNDAAKIPESIFVEHLLPVLANRSGNQSLERWQRIAGHVMRPIDVFDPKTGETLFRVPPVLRSINEEFTGYGSRSAFEIVRTAEQKRRVMPAMGDAHIRTNLVDRVKHTKASFDNVVLWNNILLRYGYEPILSNKTTEQTSATEVKKDSPDLSIDGFDDF